MIHHGRTVFAVMGIAFFQFGVGIAAHRTSPWATFERILPAPIAVRLAGAVVPAVLFAAAAAGLVVLVAHLFVRGSHASRESPCLSSDRCCSRRATTPGVSKSRSPSTPTS